MALHDIMTFAFMDLETTNIPQYNFNKANITEVSIIACTKEDLLAKSKDGVLPRIQNKLTLCFNPCMLIHPTSSEVSGLDNFMLEKHKKLDENAAGLLIAFLEHQQQPVCLLAHNGDGFDFPILKKCMEKVNLSFPEDVLCCDTLLAFREIDQIIEDRKLLQSENSEVNVETTSKEKVNPIDKTTQEKTEKAELKNITTLWEELCKDEVDWQKVNESTPKRGTDKKDIRPHKSTKIPVEKKPIKSVNQNLKSRRSLFGGNIQKPYSLPNIYERRCGKKPEISHEAEADVISLAKVVLTYGEDFIDYAQKRSIPFVAIKSLNRK